jgi:delta-aminolevulinic acid dehydratase/porphobilinogen synthase
VNHLLESGTWKATLNSYQVPPWPFRSPVFVVYAAPQLRDLVRETRLTPDAFVYPMFVCPGEGVRKEVRSMPGVFNLSVDEAVKEAQEVHSLGVPSVILFGLPDRKMT